MPDLQATSALVKKLLVFSGIVLLLAFLVVLIIFRFNTQREKQNDTKNASLELLKPPKIKTQITLTTRTFGTQAVEIESSSTDRLMLYTSGQQKDFTLSASQIAASFGLGGAPQKTENSIDFSGDSAVLSTEKAGFSFFKFPIEEKAGGFAQIDELKDRAKLFVENLGLSANFYDKVDTVFYDTLAEFETTKNNQQDANRVDIVFNFQLNGLRVFTPEKRTTVTINSNSEVTGLSYYPSNVGSPTEVYPLISFERAVERLRSGNGIIIDLLPPDNAQPVQKNLTRVTINRAYLAYYDSLAVGEIIQPVWVFEGSSQLENGLLNLKYAVPAIDEKFFKRP